MPESNDYYGGLGESGSNWASDLFSSVNESTSPADEGSWYDGITDSFGSVSETAGNWLGSYLTYQAKKDDRKFELQKLQQESILTAVEKDQQTGRVPVPVTSASALPQLGNNDKLLKMGAVFAGLVAVALLVKK